MVMERKQQALLERFFREEGSWFPNYYLFYLPAVIFLGIAMMLYIFPFQLWEGEYRVVLILFFMELMGLEMYLRRYCQFQEDGKMKNICELFQYLPVSGRQFLLYRLRKLMRVCLWMAGITAACQTLSALAFLHTVSFGNLLMPLMLCLVLPMLFLGGGMAAGHVRGAVCLRTKL